MPKFTDTFFLIPVRVFHTELEDYDDTGDFATAWARVPCEDLYNSATWYEAYPQGVMGMAVPERGFELTVLRTLNCVYLCTLPLKEFEKNLNKFMDKMDLLDEKNAKEDDLTL